MKIGVCIRAKDEQKLICDWVSHYLHLGFDRIIIYDNLSCPPLLDTLGPAGLLRDQVIVKIDDAKTNNQGRIYQESIDQNKDLDWLLLCDADEFLWIRHGARGGTSIKRFLSFFPNDCCTVVINWLVYGTGGLQTYDESKTVFEQFVRRERYAHFWNRFVKSFVRPQLISQFVNVHVTQHPSYKVCDVNRRVLEPRPKQWFLDPTLSDATPVVLVHYMTLDYESMRMKEKRNHDGVLLLKNDPKYSLTWYHNGYSWGDTGFKDDVVDHRMVAYHR